MCEIFLVSSIAHTEGRGFLFHLSELPCRHWELKGEPDEFPCRLAGKEIEEYAGPFVRAAKHGYFYVLWHRDLRSILVGGCRG